MTRELPPSPILISLAFMFPPKCFRPHLHPPRTLRYVKLLLNPFYEPNTPITTPSFDARIKALVKKHL